MRTLRVLVLLVGSALAASRVNTHTPPAKVSSPSDSDVQALTAHMEKVVTGLSGILQANKAKGMKFGQIVEPFVKSITAVLQKVKTDSKLTNAQKVEMLHNAQASVNGLAKDMVKRQRELSDESDSEKESLLIGVLMAHKSSPLAEQLSIMKSDDFKDLAVVKFVLAHQNATKGSLVEQVAAYLDGHAAAKSPTQGFLKRNMTKRATINTIVSKLQTQLANMERHLKESEEAHKKNVADIQAVEKEEDKAASLKDADAAKKKAAKHAKLIAEKRLKKINRDFLKWHAVTTKDIKSMKAAIDSIKKGDMKALAVARKALTDSLARMQDSTGAFLHFIQMSESTKAMSGSCPYCKAQCLEKCHDGGESFMSCMGKCADVGN